MRENLMAAAFLERHSGGRLAQHETRPRRCSDRTYGQRHGSWIRRSCAQSVPPLSGSTASTRSLGFGDSCLIAPPNEYLTRT